MRNTVQNIIESRTSINNFQSNRLLDEDIIKQLVELATKSPTAYNLQNWKFIATRSDKSKELLKSAAFGQNKITDASINFIICGTCNEHNQLHESLQLSLLENIIEEKVVNAWVKQAINSYEGNMPLQRDEAIRSASLAAMSLMLAAEELGLGTCPIGGFDAMKLSESFNLTDDEIPVIIIAVGFPTSADSKQKVRKSIEKVLTII